MLLWKIQLVVTTYDYTATIYEAYSRVVDTAIFLVTNGTSGFAARGLSQSIYDDRYTRMDEVDGLSAFTEVYSVNSTSEKLWTYYF